MRKTDPPLMTIADTMAYLQCSRRLSCWVPNSGTLLGTGNVGIGVHFRTFSVCAVCLEIVGIPPFWHEKGLPDFSENPQGGVRGIRTLEPLNTTNTLAGCPYRPLRHDSTMRFGATTDYCTIPCESDPPTTPWADDAIHRRVMLRHDSIRRRGFNDADSPGRRAPSRTRLRDDA